MILLPLKFALGRPINQPCGHRPPRREKDACGGSLGHFEKVIGILRQFGVAIERSFPFRRLIEA